MKSKLLSSVILFGYIGLHAQTFQKTFGGTGTGVALSTVQTPDGGYVVAGYIYANGITGIDLSLLKLDASGNVLWNKTYGGYEPDYLSNYYRLEMTGDGGFILLGYQTYPYNNCILVKTDANGDTLWTKTYKVNRPANTYNYLIILTVHQTLDGGYVMTGQLNEHDTLNQYSDGAIIIKTDGNGNIVWNRFYIDSLQPSGDGFGYDILETSDKDFVITGYLRYLIRIYKTDSSGNLLWRKEIRNIRPYGFSSLRESNDGSGYIISESAGFYGDTTYLLKTDTAGNLLWSKRYHTGLGFLGCSNLCKTNDGGYLLPGGLQNNGQTGVYGQIIKTNSTGDTLWTQRYGTPFYNSQFSATCPTADGGYFAVGVTGPNIPGGTTDMYL